MKRGNATKLKSILVFFDLLVRINQKEINYFKQQYFQDAENFEGCVDLLLSINLISIPSGYIEPSSQMIKFLKERPTERAIKEFLLMKLLDKRNLFVWDYLRKFSLTKGNFIFEPKVSENLRFSGIRNLLIELGIISFSDKENFYEITEKYKLYFISLLKKQPLTPQKLKRIIEEQDELGKLAELEIINYEKSRLSARKDLAERVEHKSLDDVTAGYDIKSFSLDENSNHFDRYIEVKAISSIEKKFYITRNELSKAREYGQNYFLYLLPVIGKNKFDIANLEILQNPEKAMLNNPRWQINCEQFVIKKEFEND